MTADHRVTVYRKGTWVWEEVDEISPRWYQHIKENDLIAQTRDDTGHSSIFSTHKAKCYLLGTMCKYAVVLVSCTIGMSYEFH